MKGFMIVGGGSRGLYFAKLIEKELKQKVKVIVDTYEAGNAKIKSFLDKQEIEDVHISNNLEEAMGLYPSEEIEGVFIMTPEWTHLKIFKQLVLNQYNIFLEKPIATKPEDVREIDEIVKAYDKVVQVGFVLRYSKFYRKIKEWIDEERIGKIISIQMNERLTLQHGCAFKRQWHSKKAYTGGYLNEKCSHDIDLMCWFKQNQAKPIKVVSCGSINFCKDSIGENLCEQCKRENCPYRDNIRTHGNFYEGKVYMDETSDGIGKCVYGRDTDVYDHQSMLLVFDDDTHGVFSSITMSGIAGRDITLHGTHGVISGNLEQADLICKEYFTAKEEVFDVDKLDGHGGGDGQIIKEFMECIEMGERPYASVRDGVNASLIAFACDESIEKGSFIEI